jgi:hypothetical protein
MEEDKKINKEPPEKEVQEVKKEEINEENSVIKKSRIAKENKMLINIFIVVGLIFLIFILIIFISKSSSHFKYKGVEFTTISYGDLVLYNTTFPVIYNKSVRYYVAYLRNDPRDLKKEIPFDGDILLLEDVVLNQKGDFVCDGDYIGIQNVLNTYSALGVTVISDSNASCDESGRYTYIVIQPGNETSIEQFGPSCYNININNCEILKGTERYLAEMLVQIHNNIYEDGE